MNTLTSGFRVLLSVYGVCSFQRCAFKWIERSLRESLPFLSNPLSAPALLPSLLSESKWRVFIFSSPSLGLLSFCGGLLGCFVLVSLGGLPTPSSAKVLNDWDQMFWDSVTVPFLPQACLCLVPALFFSSLPHVVPLQPKRLLGHRIILWRDPKSHQIQMPNIGISSTTPIHVFVQIWPAHISWKGIHDHTGC